VRYRAHTSSRSDQTVTLSFASAAPGLSDEHLVLRTQYAALYAAFNGRAPSRLDRAWLALDLRLSGGAGTGRLPFERMTLTLPDGTTIAPDESSMTQPVWEVPADLTTARITIAFGRYRVPSPGDGYEVDFGDSRGEFTVSLPAG
jgi:hypothetical protein